jgi:hypothetical protein
MLMLGALKERETIMKSGNNCITQTSHVFDPGRKTGNFLLMLLILPFMLAAELRHALDRKVYHGSTGFLRGMIGTLSGFVSAATVGHHCGWVLGWGLPAWLAASVAAWFGTVWYVWPVVYLLFVKPALKLVEMIWKRFDRITVKYAQQLFSGIVAAVGRVLPGSSYAWEAVLRQKTNGWVTILTYVLSGLLTLTGAACAGLWVFHAVATGFGSCVPGTIIAAFAGSVGGLLLGGLTFQLLAHGKLPFVAVATGIGFALMAGEPRQAVSALSHLSGWQAAAGQFVAFVLFVGYIFPLAQIVLSGTWIKWLFCRVRPLIESAYADRDKDYLEFFHNVAVLLLTFLAAKCAFSGIGILELPVWASAPVLAAAVLLSYLWCHAGLNNVMGNLFTALSLSIYSGFFLARLYLILGLPGGIWMSVTSGALASLLAALLAFPVAYNICKLICKTLGISKSGKLLGLLHGAVVGACRKFLACLERSGRECYSDNSGYQVWFLHVANIAFAAAAAIYLPAARTTVAAVTPAGSQFAASLHVLFSSLSANAVFAAQGLAFVLSYILVGKFLQKSSAGMGFAGAISSLVLASGVVCLTVGPGSQWWTSGIVGLLVWSSGFCVVFPVAYRTLRVISKEALASWSTDLLVRLHDFAWSCFAATWKKFVVLCRLIHKYVLARLLTIVSRVCAAVLQRLAVVWFAVYKTVYIPFQNALIGAVCRLSEIYGSLLHQFRRHSR